MKVSLKKASLKKKSIESERYSINKKGLQQLEKIYEISKRLNNDRKKNAITREIRLKEKLQEANVKGNSKEVNRISKLLSNNESYINNMEIFHESNMKTLSDNIINMKNDLKVVQNLTKDLKIAKSRRDPVEINLIKTKLEAEESTNIQNNKLALDKLQEEDAAFHIEYKKRNEVLRNNLAAAKDSNNSKAIKSAKKLMRQESEYQHQNKLLFKAKQNVYLSPNRLDSLSKLQFELSNNETEIELRKRKQKE